jgi:hypothetical protein
MPTDLATIDNTSEAYLGEWKRLVSTTNWEKGRIIAAWRIALIEADAPASEFSDDAWSQRVGNVTPQHVGRLRRVHERFGEVRETYAGLFWSHFQAALDWNDAELWLEGAVQNDWSVAHMRRQRWEALGASDDLKPRESDIITAELDEDVDTFEDRQPEVAFDDELEATQIAENNETDHEDDDEPADSSTAEESSAAAAAPAHRPFAELPSLPADLTDAFESFKLCIVHHRQDGWREISLDDMLASLDALKELALAAP